MTVASVCKKLGIGDQQTVALLDRYIVLFEKWNRSINLSAARTVEQIAEHVCDCLHVVPHVPGGKLLDVGAGGGLPGVVVAICRPEVAVTSIEPVAKKQAFLRSCARELHLANYQAFAQRLEQHEHADYDCAISRATWDIVEWLERGQTVVRSGGIVLGMEAIPVSELPTRTTRHSYPFRDKQRAILVRTKESSSIDDL